MLYNSNVLYDEPQITYIGTVRIRVNGINNPIVLSEVAIAASLYQDLSNATMVAFISYDVIESGYITIESSQFQQITIESSQFQQSALGAEVTLATQ